MLTFTCGKGRRTTECPPMWTESRLIYELGVCQWNRNSVGADVVKSWMQTNGKLLPSTMLGTEQTHSEQVLWSAWKENTRLVNSPTPGMAYQPWPRSTQVAPFCQASRETHQNTGTDMQLVWKSVYSVVHRRHHRSWQKTTNRNRAPALILKVWLMCLGPSHPPHLSQHQTSDFFTMVRS